MADKQEQNSSPEQLRTGADRPENEGNRNDQRQGVSLNPDESISTADGTANGKGSRTGLRKDEKEANDNFDKGRT